MSSLTQTKSGFEGRLTPQQAEALEQLKVRNAQSPFAKELAEHPDGDRWVLRFLRATMKDKSDKRLFQVEEAFERLMRTMEWRKKNNVEAILQGFVAGKQSEVVPSKYGLFKKLIPSVYVVNEETGDLQRFDRFGLSLSNVDESAMSVEDWTMCVAYEMEYVLHTIRVTSARIGKEISTYTTMADTNKMSLTGIIGRRKFVQFFSELGAEYYPEMLGKTFLIRAPWYFDKIWALTKPFIDKDTLGKLAVSSGVPMEEVQKLIPISIVLKEFGGENPLELPMPDFKAKA